MVITEYDKIVSILFILTRRLTSAMMDLYIGRLSALQFLELADGFLAEQDLTVHRPGYLHEITVGSDVRRLEYLVTLAFGTRA